jgi:hypothetical protein
MELKSSYYNKYYNSILNDIIDNLKENNNLLLSVKNELLLSENIEFIIKKKNIKITILNDNSNNKEFKNNIIKNNELFNNENSINILNNKDEINLFKNNNNNIIFNIIILFHIDSIDSLQNTLMLLDFFINNNTKLYLYASLSNESLKKIKYKNFIRNSISKYTKNSMGNVIEYKSLLNFIYEYNKYNINSLKIYKNNNYILYGNNIVYEIILVKNSFN